MKVLSLLQPWASLVVLGHKKIETRSWNIKHRGELLIHASKKKITSDLGNQFYKHYHMLFAHHGMPPIDDLPLGAIIGKVNLEETFSIGNKMNTEEKIYRAETCQAPLGETGDYDSWIELVTPNLNLQCYDPNVEVEEVEELAEMLNKSAEMEKAIKEVLELFDGNGVPNIEWVKNRLSEAVK